LKNKLKITKNKIILLLLNAIFLKYSLILILILNKLIKIYLKYFNSFVKQFIFILYLTKVYNTFKFFINKSINSITFSDQI